MDYVIGVDPGKTGGFALIDQTGRLVSAVAMPTEGGKVTAHKVAGAYHDFRSRLPIGVAPTVVVEKIFTRPSDAMSVTQMRVLVRLAHAYRSGARAVDHVEGLMDLLQGMDLPDPDKIRVDGRVGNLTYAKAAGHLYMPALWGWPVVEVSPKTWCTAMHRSIDKNMPPKAKSRTWVSQHYPELMGHQGPFLTSSRAKVEHEGMVDAFMIAQWYRQHHLVARSA